MLMAYISKQIEKMGNIIQTKNSNIQMYIETQKQFYNSGSSVEGVILVIVKNILIFDALYLRIDGKRQQDDFIGQQYCQWLENSSKNRRKYTGHQHFYYVEHQIMSLQNRQLTVGNYAFPFSFEISENIPGTFHSEKYDARISYKLMAYYANYTHHRYNFYSSIPLIIRQPFRLQRIAIQGEDQRSPKRYGCQTKGRIGLDVWFQKNVSFEEEEIKIEINVDNKFGTHPVKQIIINLIQYTFLSAKNGSFQTYEDTISSVKLSQIVEINKNKTVNYTMKIPLLKNQTAISTLVANYYRLQVHTSLGFLSTNNPCVYASIHLLKKSFETDKVKYKKTDLDLLQFKTHKFKYIKVTEFWFKKNKHLNVINFRIDDTPIQQ